MPTSLNFPSTLPLPRRAGYRLKPMPMQGRAQADQGAARVRRRVTSTLTEIPVVFAVDEEQGALLEGFIEHEARHGEAWFNVSLLGPGGIVDHEARIKGDYRQTFLGNGRWEVEATLEVRNRPILSAAALTALIGPAGTPLAWPAELPLPKRDSYRIEPRPVVLRSDGEVGLAKMRQRPGREADATLTFAMDGAQAAIFESFLEHRARHGAAWFALCLRSLTGLRDHDVRFKGDVELEFLGGDRWLVNAPVEMRDRPMLTREELALRLAASVDAHAGRAVGVTLGGTEIVSEPIVSPFMGVVAVRRGADGSVEIRTGERHGLRTGELVETCIGGWHGVTERAHPGNVTATAVAVRDDYWISLVGTVWVENCVFLGGEVWRSNATLIPAAAILNTLSQTLKDAGGGFVYLPWGYIGLETTLIYRDNVLFVGKGVDATHLVSLDANTSHVTQEAGTRNSGAIDLEIVGHRQRKNAMPGLANVGLHCIRAGADGVETYNFLLRRVRARSSPGYGVGLQSDGWFVRCIFEVWIIECDSDGLDCKNRLNQNDANVLVSAVVQHFGLRAVGCNVPDVTLVTNPFTMTSGSSLVTVAHVLVEPYNSGIKVTYPNAGVVRGIDLGGTFEVVGQASGGYVIQAGQSATSSGVGGGAGIIEQAAAISSGDAGIDLRGINWSGDDILVEGRATSLTMFRLREGDEDDVNGLGGMQSRFGRIKVRNTSTNRSNALGVYVGGRDNTFEEIHAIGLRDALFLATPSEDNTVALLRAYDCTNGFWDQGVNNRADRAVGAKTGAVFASYSATGSSCGVLEADAECTVGGYLYPDSVGATIEDRSGVHAAIELIDVGTDSVLTPAASFHGDVYQWAHAVLTNSGGATNDTEMGWRHDFIEAQGDLYARAYDYHLWGATANAVASRVSLKYRVLATAFGGPVFTAMRGQQGNASTALLDLRLNARTIMAADGKAQFSSLTLNEVAAGNKTVMGVGGGSAMRSRLRTSADKIGGQVMSTLAASAETVTSTKGYRSTRRVGPSSSMIFNVDGVDLAAVTVGSLATLPPDNNWWVLGHNSGGGLQEPTDSQVFITSIEQPMSEAENAIQCANFLALAEAAGAWPS